MSAGAVHFGAPWALAALALLPVLWLLLRASPPAPLRIRFPPLALLRGLESSEETPDSAPLWLRLLRLLLATLIILALAAPTWTPRGATPATGPLVLIVDNGWASAPHWQKLRKTALGLVNAADGDVAVLLSAAPGKTLRFVPRQAARQALGDASARPWPPRRMAALGTLRALKQAGGLPQEARIVWLSDGLDHGHARAFMAALAALTPAPVQVFTPPQGEGQSLLMLPPRAGVRGLDLTLHRLEGRRAQSVIVQALDKDGAIVARQTLNFAAGQTQARGSMVLPLPLRNRLQLLQTPALPSAGSSWVFDSGWVRPLAGLITSGGDQDRQPLLSGIYYLGKALAPHAQVQRGTVDELLQLQPAVMVLTDPAAPDAAELEKLDTFVRNGGLLIRFAGPHLAASSDDLVPVRLRTGGRLMGGAFGWESPQTLAPFAPDSPFAGLTGGADAAVRRQVLALPDEQLNERTWARLSDGTPLVTSAPRGKGRIVLFHVTAAPDWSDLPLSGLFAAMLERTLAFASAPSGAPDKRANWVLELALGADGALHPPDGAAPVLPPTRDIEDAKPGPRQPPGLYRNGARSRALNIGRAGAALTPLPAAPPGVRRIAGAGAQAFAFKAPLLLAALVLLMADTMAALILAGRLRGLGRMLLRRDSLAVLALAAVFLPARPGHAGDAITRALDIARDTHLAYMITGDSRVDAMSKAGLSGLSLILRQRTTVEPAMPVGVDPERDELAVFPLIYWPVLRPPELSPRAAAALNNYLKHGGMLVIDTQDDGQRAIAAGGVDPALAALFAQIRIPPLHPIPADHVLTRSYYLIHSFPGRTTGGRLWVEADVRGSSLDGVSGVIAGANDWAAAWALDGNGRPMAALSDDMPRQREMARRFGVNLVMYALTGNYKADQVHIPAVLQRLGEQ